MNAGGNLIGRGMRNYEAQDGKFEGRDQGEMERGMKKAKRDSGRRWRGAGG